MVYLLKNVIFYSYVKLPPGSDFQWWFNRVCQAYCSNTIYIYITDQHYDMWVSEKSMYAQWWAFQRERDDSLIKKGGWNGVYFLTSRNRKQRLPARKARVLGWFPRLPRSFPLIFLRLRAVAACAQWELEGSAAKRIAIIAKRGQRTAQISQ